MPKRLAQNLDSAYIAAANRLNGRHARRKIVVYVESYDDVFFWSNLLRPLETPQCYFEVMLPSRTSLCKGKKMAFVDPGSTSGNLIPTSMLMKAFANENLDSETLHMNEKFFSSAMYAGKHQASIQAVAKGDVDVAAVSDQILQAEINNGNVNAGDIKVIATSDPIPSEGMIIRADMDQNLRKTLTDFLLQYNNEDYFTKVIKVKGARFVEASKTDYQPIIELNQLLNT